MRSAKTLSRMTKKEIKEQLPNWFEGEVYGIGDEVRNPYSGDTALLDAAALSLYDAVKGAAMVMFMGVANMDVGIDVINQGKDWMLAKNPQAYMILLD